MTFTQCLRAGIDDTSTGTETVSSVSDVKETLGIHISKPHYDPKLWTTCRKVSCLATDSPCSVCCCGLIICFLHDGLVFWFMFLMTVNFKFDKVGRYCLLIFFVYIDVFILIFTKRFQLFVLSNSPSILCTTIFYRCKCRMNDKELSSP